MVDQTGEQLGMSQEQKTLANVYFRHLWYFIFPLYPPFIFLQQMTDLPYLTVLLPGLIIAMAVFIATSWSSFRHAKWEDIVPENHDSQGATRTFILSVLPLAVILITAIAFQTSFPWAVAMGIVTALLAVPGEDFTWLNIKKRILQGVLPGIDWRILGAVVGIVFFSRTVVNSQAMMVLVSNLASQPSSLLLFSFITPFVAGLITGSHQASLGLSLPLLLPVVQGMANPFPFFTVLYFTALAGYLISPAHVCLIGTTQYLKANLTKTWRLAWLPTVIILSLSLVYLWWSL